MTTESLGGQRVCFRIQSRRATCDGALSTPSTREGSPTERGAAPAAIAQKLGRPFQNISLATRASRGVRSPMTMLAMILLLVGSTSALQLARGLRGATPRMAANGAPRIELTQPKQAESEEMGIRDWPSLSVSEPLEQQCNDGALRYVLEGSGTVDCAGESFAVTPNTLITVRSEEGATLRWTLDDGCAELIILTPEYQGPPLLPIIGAFLAACVVLVASTAGG